MPLDLKIVPVWVGNRQRTYKRCFLQLDTCMYDGGDSKTRIFTLIPLIASPFGRAHRPYRCRSFWWMKDTYPFSLASI
uniref:AlNc14C303G10406 protein n=1 Tax=Albugo laibachii Nc14 TaxID=890382 RepID=F0WVR8_9STRA|nr:AlNc14C303G10406 [Albugo laibachii Nc14]|eukprot:CCA25514.1 AlNc14C303G10406 [Albugo laibachii Nc14]